MKVLSDILFDGNIIASNLPQANGGVYKAVLINKEDDENKFVEGELSVIPIEEKGDVVIGTDDGEVIRLPIGTKGQVLTVKQVGEGQADLEPRWEDPPHGLENPMTKRADIIVGGQDGVPEALEAPISTDTHFLTTRLNDTQTQREVRWQNKILPSNVLVAPKSLLGRRDTSTVSESIAVGEGLDIKVINNVATLVKSDTVYYFGENPGIVAPGTGINITEFGEVALNRFLPISTVGMWTVKLDLTFVCNVGYEYWEYRVLDHKTLEFIVIVRNIFDKNKLVIAEHIPSLKVSKHLGTYTYDDMSEAKFASEGIFNEETIKVSLVKVEDINSIYHNLKIENNLDRITAFNPGFNDFKIFTKIKVHTDEFSVPQL